MSNEIEKMMVTDKDAKCIKIDHAIYAYLESHLAHAYACINNAEGVMVVIMTSAPMSDSAGDYETVRQYVTDAEHVDLAALYVALTEGQNWKVLIYAQYLQSGVDVKIGFGV